MEYWDLYDEQGNITDGYCKRDSELPDNRFHLIVHVWIKNKEGKYLISKRSANKLRFPSMWDCVVGAVLKGESSIDGALREVKEEVGIDLLPNDGEIIKTITRKTIDGIKHNEIADVWLFEYNGPVSLENATTDEVSEIKWMSKDQINNLLITGKMVPTLKYFLTDKNFKGKSEEEPSR